MPSGRVGFNFAAISWQNSIQHATQLDILNNREEYLKKYINIPRHLESSNIQQVSWKNILVFVCSFPNVLLFICLSQINQTFYYINILWIKLK